MSPVSIRGPCDRFVSLNNRAGTVILLAVALGAGAVFGQGHTLWQDGGVQLCGTSADFPMAAVSDSAGGAIVVWTDTRNWPDRVYAQRVDAAGVPQWTANGVLLIDSAWSIYCLDVISDGGHGAIAAQGAASRLRVQRVNDDGVPLWGPKGLVLRDHDGLPETEYWSSVVPDGRGGAIVVWSVYVLAGVPDTLLACRVDSGGNTVWETPVRIDTLDMAPCVCEDGHGGAIVAWSEYEGGTKRVRVQRVDSAGAIRWGSAGVLACTLSATQGARACVASGESRFVVGLCARGSDTWHNRTQMFDLAGNRRWGPTGVQLGDSGSAGAIGLATGHAGQSIWAWFEN
jgi:hypothetical protein